MSAATPPTPIYELEITAVGPLVQEFTAFGVWVFFGQDAPPELLEFALLHDAAAPSEPIAPGHVLEVAGERYAVTGVGALANDNIRTLGHMVLKVDGATEPELPGEVCLEARPLPEPTVGTTVRIWKEHAHGPV